MHISHWASTAPNQIAVRMVYSGETATYAELEAASNRSARLLRSLGLGRGDVFALWSNNNLRFVELTWAMKRSGLYMVPIASKLTAAEAAYIVNDCRATILVVDASIGQQAEILSAQLSDLCPEVEALFVIGGTLHGRRTWEEAAATMPADPIGDQSRGLPMIYSSGTTGYPKGVRRELPEAPFDASDDFARYYRSDDRSGSVFMITAPMYHSGPLGIATAELERGSSLLIFERFDPERVLSEIDRRRVQGGQFVPTMFTRLLKLPAQVRERYDVSSLELAVHSAGPCPRDVKQAMIEWWGPVLFELYGGTENVGMTMIDSHEWLRKPGSVGRAALGRIHVCAEDGTELGANETGTIYFEGNSAFGYLNDPEKTRGAQNPLHPAWATLGDIGRVDEDGYLFLSDRRAFMIICGGVNIYPQEAENVLTLHPDVADVAVFGVPDADLGEQVKAVVQPADWSAAGPRLEAELIAYCKSRLASLKCPKSIDFERALPRDAVGKMMKKAVRDRYWPRAPHRDAGMA